MSRVIPKIKSTVVCSFVCRSQTQNKSHDITFFLSFPLSLNHFIIIQQSIRCCPLITAFEWNWIEKSLTANDTYNTHRYALAQNRKSVCVFVLFILFFSVSLSSFSLCVFFGAKKFFVLPFSQTLQASFVRQPIHKHFEKDALRKKLYENSFWCWRYYCRCVCVTRYVVMMLIKSLKSIYETKDVHETDTHILKHFTENRNTKPHNDGNDDDDDDDNAAGMGWDGNEWRFDRACRTVSCYACVCACIVMC